MKAFVGIDYSITSPCVAVYVNDKDFSFEHIHFHYLTSIKREEGVFGPSGNIHGASYPVYKSDEERHHKISEWVLTNTDRFATFGIEGYSMGSKGRVFNLAENCGLLKWKLWIQKSHYTSIPPTVVKKFATGKGNANKEAMYDAFVADTGVDLIALVSPNKKLGNPVTDIVDAYYILKYVVKNS